MGPHAGGSNIVATTLLFAIVALTAIVLLVAAFVAWLSALIGSLVLALLITGGTFAVVAFIIYKAALHPTLATIRREYESIATMARYLQQGYSWAIEHLACLFFPSKK